MLIIVLFTFCIILISRYIQETLGLHELAPQYRQFYHIFEAFKIANNKPDIPPPTLAIPTSLSSKVPMATLGDQFQEENEEGEDVCKIFVNLLVSNLFSFCRRNWKIKARCLKEN